MIGRFSAPKVVAVVSEPAFNSGSGVRRTVEEPTKPWMPLILFRTSARRQIPIPRTLLVSEAGREVG